MFNIPQKIVVGLLTNPTVKTMAGLSDAELSPKGFNISKYEKKRIINIQKASSSTLEFDNTEMPGFSFFNSSKKTWAATKTTHVVVDPRGFTFRISSENLDHILHTATISNGLIQDKCVWIRNDSYAEMYLVPITSELYDDAVNGTQLLNNKVSKYDVNIGDKVLLQNELVGTYLGKASLYCNFYPYYDNSTGNRVLSELNQNILQIDDKTFYYHKDLKMLKIIEKAAEKLTQADAISIMNKAINNGAYFSYSESVNRGYQTDVTVVRHVSSYATYQVKLTTEKVTKDEAKIIYSESLKFIDISCLICEDKEGKRFLINYPKFFNSVNPHALKFSVLEIDKIEDHILYLKEKRPTVNHLSLPQYTLDSFVKFYKVTKHLGNEIYN